jgi:uncharacterized ferritin-like protein (DUF455 family)
LDSLLAYGAAALTASDPHTKAQITFAAARAFAKGGLPLGTARPPERPARPPRPLLYPPRAMPKRSAATAEGRIALLHALAHIELNAIDLAWDLLCRFGGATSGLPLAFHADWLAVAADEAKHFSLLSRRLQSLGATYGDHPAHDGLWAAAQRTGHDLLARLAIVPLIHEAHGLDVTPGIMMRLRRAGDLRSARLLGLIGREEIRHVRAGRIWFEHCAAESGFNPREIFSVLVKTYYGGTPKPPFNEAARRAAGLEDYIVRS